MIVVCLVFLSPPSLGPCPCVLLNSREKVKEAMGFALDHADASGDVVGVLKESLLVPETPIHGADSSTTCLRRRQIDACLIAVALHVDSRSFCNLHRGVKAHCFCVKHESCART